MKQFRRFLWALLLIGMAIAIYSSAVGETAPEKINWGGAEPAAGSWARTADAMEFSYPMDAARDEPTILLRSAWQKYQVLVDGNAVYTASSERNGAFHLFRLPPGQELTVRFLDCAPGSGAESAVLQSQVYFGSRSGIQWMILRENLYAVLFSGFALVLGIACLLAAYCMQRQHFGNFYGSVYSLGAYILLAGVWVLTDSKILLLVSQKAGLVGLISYLSFHALHLPLLQFTIGVLPEKRRMLEILQTFYSGLLLLLMANFIFSLPYLNVLVMAGYVLFAVCSILAITIYYLDSSLPYSPVYMLGIFGFILLLAETAGQRVLEQINENANMAMYAKLAYRDVLTGLGNRAAFVRETQETKQSAAPFGYIMVDVNDLKKVNDTLGHPKGDALINRVAQCLQRAAAEKGNCYRIGGDEFVVSLNGSREALLACADRIREEIAAADAGSEFPVSAALGLAWSEDQPDPIPAQVFRQADDAMYADKKRMKASRKAEWE